MLCPSWGIGHKCDEIVDAESCIGSDGSKSLVETTIAGLSPDSTTSACCGTDFPSEMTIDDISELTLMGLVEASPRLLLMAVDTDSVVDCVANVDGVEHCGTGGCNVVGKSMGTTVLLLPLMLLLLLLPPECTVLLNPFPLYFEGDNVDCKR